MQVEIEFARLDALKANKMKELMMKRQIKLEKVCIFAHIELDASMMEDKLIALIDSCDLHLPYLPQNFANIVLYFSLISSVEWCRNANLITVIAHK
jgi:hypothetical protein